MPNPDPKPTRGQKAADWLESKIGWPFIIGMNCFILGWCLLNSFLVLGPESLDPFPWVLLNLLLSFQAAQTGPIVLISGRRQTELQHLILRQILDMVGTLKAMLTVLIEHQSEAKARDTLLLQHVLKASERDERSQKRDECIVAMLKRIEEKLDAHQ